MVTPSVQASSDPAKVIRPEISVIVPIYNGETDIPDLLDCIEKQTFPIDKVEYLLVDNGSCDRTSDLIQASIQRFKDQGISLQYLQEVQIQSAYAARNTGIRAAQGEILVFTDADCRPQPQWLQELINGFDTDKVGLVAGNIEALPGNHWLEKYAEKEGFLDQQHTLKHPFCPYGQTANLAIRRTAFNPVGLFRPYMTTGGDADICWRIQKQSDWSLNFAPHATVYHRHRASLPELRKQWYRYGRSNRYLHALHGIPLERALTPKEIRYRLARWVLKEIPLTLSALVRRKADFLDLCSTPLDLYCRYARTQGQTQTTLSVETDKIDWNLPITTSHPS